MYEGDQMYAYKNAIVAEQGRWALRQEALAIRTNLHQGTLFGTKIHRWALTMSSLNTGVVIH